MSMQILLNRKNDAVHFEASNEDGIIINLDGSDAVGGENKGFRPMQTLLAGLGGCSSIDLVSILKKQRQVIDDIQLVIDAKREEEIVPSLFTEINVHFKLKGKIDEVKLKKALALTFEKYCSVAMIIGKSAKITYSYNIN